MEMLILSWNRYLHISCQIWCFSLFSRFLDYYFAVLGERVRLLNSLSSFQIILLVGVIEGLRNLVLKCVEREREHEWIVAG
jgi:hypothetical protein